MEWKYEEEYRMILNYNKLADGVVTPPQKYIKGMRVYVKFPGKTMYFKKIPEEVISAIYIGCRAENKEKIIKKFNQAKEANPKLEHVKIYESILDDNDFKVIYRKIHFTMSACGRNRTQFGVIKMPPNPSMQRTPKVAADLER